MSGGGRASLDRMPEWGNASYKDGVDEDVYQAAFDAVESLLYPTDSMTSSFPTAADRNGICDYRSLRRSPASKSSIREGDWVGTSSLRRPHAPKAPKPPSLPGLDRPAPPDSLPVKSVLEGDPGLGRSHAVFSGSISPTSPAETYSVAQVQKFHSSNGSLNSSIFLEDLRESELHLKRKKAFIERVIEQHENLSEQKRRQDIFQLCEKLQEVEVASNKPHHKSSRIKTNGSLPREKSGTDSSLPSSPVKSCSSSDDIQTLRLSDGVQPSSQAKAQSPSALQTSHGYENVPSNACVARRARQAAASNGVSADRPFRLLDCPASPASPLSTPGSPRRGIKTVLAAKETFSFPQEITNEVIENHLGLSELYKPTQQLSSKGKPSENTSPFCSPFGSLALTSTPREQTRESVRGRNGQSSPAVVTKDKFIFPLHDSRVCNHGELLSEKVVALSLELEFVQKERLKIMSALTVLKSRLAEIESQQEEAARDVAMEQAFIKAELQAKADKLRAQKAKILSLQERADSCQREIESWQENRNKQQKIFSMSVENAEVDLTQLRSELGRCEGEEARAELKERIYQQTDVVDSEKKLYEDLEFKYLEEESVWLARKEELNKELSDALKKYDEYSDQVSQLESWLTGPNESSVAQSEGLAEQKLAYLQRLEEGQSQLDLLDARIDELVGQGAGTLGSSQNISRDVNESELMNASSTGDLDSTDVSSERLCNSPLPNSLESSYYSYHLNASLYGDGDREAAPSQTSRRDRERRTTEDGEPEGRRRAEDGSKSGVDSDTSSNAKYFPVSSPVGSDGVLGVHGAVLSRSASQSTSTIGDLVGHSGHGGAGVPGLLDGAVAGTLPLCRRRRPEAERTLPRHQRPLTRYLPIRAADLDLRQHIESAGHAVDLCSHVILDGHSCRGTLHKASTRFGNWQKRWFLFDRTSRTLTYYKSRRDRHVRGGVHFQSIAEVYVDHLHGAKHHPNCVFVVKTTQRSYQLTAPTPEAMRIWVDVIFTGAEAYQEFD